MGRRPQGYRVRPPKRKGGPYTVRWTIDGKREELSTGERDRAAAEREAREKYAAALSGRGGRVGPSATTIRPEVTAAWLADLTVRPTTRDTYEKYSDYWLRDLRRIDEHAIALYVRRRLREVRGKSVRSEVSALRAFVKWLVEMRHLGEAPPIPVVPTAALGKQYEHRRRVAAPDLSDAEIRAVLRRLPDKAATGWWVRPRCELLYETGLRPSTIDRLRVPEHWAPGASELFVSQDIDKEGFERIVPLTPKARRILKRCAPEAGLIFGPHRYDPYVGKAAKAALSGTKARTFTAQHFRSARATHLLDAGAPLPGVQQLLGHKHVSTTARYIRPTFKAAQAALNAKR
jgi:integrase